MVPAFAFAEYKLNLQTPNTALGQTIYDLHTLVTWVCVVIFVVVFSEMFYAIYKHRKSVGHPAANFHEHFWVEVAWTILPTLILIAIAVPATKALIQMRDTSEPDMTIKVTGHQWMWGYDYLQGEGEGISFVARLSTPRAQIQGREPKGPNYLLETDNHVVVPTGKKVRVLVTAADVIHAWYVPALAVKQDAIPGFIRDTWFKAKAPGIYRGQCAELCGRDHGFMPIVVEVMTPTDYSAWVAKQKAGMKRPEAVAAAADKAWTLDELKAQGDKVYAANCVACHQATGAGAPPAFPPLTGSKLAVGAKSGAIDMVLNGKPGTAMAPFKHLSDADIAGVLTYIRNNWANKTGDMVTPAEVKAARGGGAPVAAPAAAPAAAAPAAALPASVYYDTGKAVVTDDSKKTLDDVIAQLKANANTKVEITGYTDKTGNLAQNMDLAKDRAVGVRDALIAAGVAKDRINMKPPATVEAGGDPRQARRVDIKPGA
ncbi:MAG: cytochrome c oxidase subunit II [Betaproteobacteria bacterium]|nr:cytochrome c oxidase subunit II [Betaproteobacteria bacterium]